VSEKLAEELLDPESSNPGAKLVQGATGRPRLPRGGIDPAKLKLRELAEVEKVLGRRIAGELQSGDLGMDTMQALVWVALCQAAGVRPDAAHQDPAATFDQAGEFDMDGLARLFAADEDDAEVGPLDPTRPPPSAGDAASGNGATTSAVRPPSTTSGG
jgi:hypothetical protein